MAPFTQWWPRGRREAVALVLPGLLLFAVFHYVLRYVLRFSEDATGVDYRDAPLWFKVLKDVALVVALGVLAVLWRSPAVVRERVDALARPHRLLLVAAVLSGAAAGAVALVTIALDRAPAEPALLHTFRYPFLPIAGLVLWILTIGPERTASVVRMLFVALVAGSLGFWLFTVAAYFVVGKEPALSQPGLLRFGGPLDDPNGFGILLTAMYLWLDHERVRGRGGRVVLALQLWAALAVVLTRSLSAALCFGVAVALSQLPRLRELRQHWRTVGGHAVVAAAVGGAGLYTLATSDIKQSGLSTRLEQGGEALQQSRLGELLLGEPSGVRENFYQYLFESTGIVLTVAFLALVGAVLVLAVRRPGPSAWALPWMAGVLVAAAFIPYLQVYPVSLWFWALGGAALTGDGALAAAAADPVRAGAVRADAVRADAAPAAAPAAVEPAVSGGVPGAVAATRTTTRATPR